MLRKAAINDLHKVMYVVDEVKEDMNSQGNDQFDDNYPREEHFRDDIENESLFVKCIGIDIAGVICVNNKEFTDYEKFNWSKKTSSTVFYRLVVNKSYRRKGIARELVSLAEDISRMQGLNYIKGATYEINKPMISLFENLNYNFVGKSYVDNKKYPFYYYEKLL